MSTAGIDLSRLVRYEEVDGGRWVVGHGDRREGQRGKQIGVVSLKHVGGYEVVLHLDNGRVDTFSPMQLFPEASHG